MKRIILFFQSFYLLFCLLKARATIVALMLKSDYLALQNHYLLFRLRKTLAQNGGRAVLIDKPSNPLDGIKCHAGMLPDSIPAVEKKNQAANSAKVT
jgi:hypothetical protein